MELEALRDLRALLERAGGRQALRLAGEARPSELETFARDLLAEALPPPPEGQPGEAPAAVAPTLRRARMRSGGAACAWRDCALLFALFRAAPLQPPRWPRERRRLREILRDLRAQLPRRPPPALVGVVLLPAGAAEAAEAARLQLEGLLRRVFRERRRRSHPGLPDTVQAVAYRPGEPQPAREAACRSLRAALKLRADGVESPKLKLPAFLWCVPWGRRNEDFHQDPELNEGQEVYEFSSAAKVSPYFACIPTTGVNLSGE